MHRIPWRRAATPLLAALALVAPSVRAADDPRGTAFFESKIRPVLVNQCFECHSNATRDHVFSTIRK